MKGLLEGALGALWHGEIEDDGFNALVLDAHLTWRQVVVLRAYAKYLRQAGTTFSQYYVERVLRANVTVTRLLVRLFESRFDPDRQAGRAERSDAIAEEIRGELDEVASLDQDRILRAYWGLIEATLRTNYFQRCRGRGTPGCRTSWPSSTPPGCPTCPPRGRGSSCSSTRPGSRACTCGSPTSPAAACAGPTGRRTSGPRYSAWPRRRR